MHLSCSTSTGYRGVYEKAGGRFEAVYIGVNGDVYVGVFETALSAAVAYARAVEAASVIAGGAAEPMIQAPISAEQAAAAGEQRVPLARVRPPSWPMLASLHPAA